MQTQKQGKKINKSHTKMEKKVEEQNTEHISFISKSEQFIEKNKNLLIIIVVAIVVVVLGYFGIKKFVSEPRRAKANVEIFPAEQYFAFATEAQGEGNYRMALYGDSPSNDKFAIGLLAVIDKYGSTPAGNRARLAGPATRKLRHPFKSRDRS